MQTFVLPAVFGKGIAFFVILGIIYAILTAIQSPKNIIPSILLTLFFLVPLILDQFFHRISITKNQLIFSSILTGKSETWMLTELDISGTRQFEWEDKLPVVTSHNFWKLERGQQFGTVKLENGNFAFHFYAREDARLVVIPLKVGGHILLEIKTPEVFIDALKAKETKLEERT
jgi:hypothetical protein